MSKLLLLLVFLLMLAPISYAQSCNPASVAVLLRDSNGTALSEADVKTVAAALPKEIGDAGVWVGNTSLAADQKSYYWEEQTDFEKGKKMPALMFSNAGTCTMHLNEVRVDYQGMQMTLVFNINIERSTRDRRPLIYAPPFQNGTFELDLTNWTHDPHTIITEKYWRRKN
jgi:hypothetical protein